MSTRTLALRLSGLSLSLCLLAPLTADATHSWNGYHWARTANPFTLKLGNNLTSSQWSNLLGVISSDWNSGNTPVLTALTAGAAGRNCKMVLGTTQVCNGKYGNNGWLGLASINIKSDGHITQGTAKMNDTYFNLSTYNNPNERRHVICQEVAHTFGLGHQSEDGSSLNTCMDYFSNTGVNATSTLSTTPNAHDFDELNIIYAHLDNFTTLSATSSATAASEIDTNSANDWGQLMSQSANGRSSSYERGLKDGSVLITHVYWTEEAAERCHVCDHRYDH